MELMIRDMPVFYEEIGSGKPILCMHGYGADHKMMSGCMEPVFEKHAGYRRVYMDVPAMGRTPPRNWLVNADVMLETIIEFTDRVFPGESFLLAGESYGGYMSLGMIHRIKPRIDGAFFLCPCFTADMSTHPAKGAVYMDESLLSELHGKDTGDYLGLAVSITRESWELYERDVLPGEKLRDYDFLDQYMEKGYRLSFDKDLYIETFDKPSCFLVGRQDHIVGYKAPYRVAERFSRATFSMLDSAGHSLQTDTAPLFYAHLEDWLQRVEHFPCKNDRGMS